MHATGTQTIHFDGYFVPEDGFICEWRTGAFGVLEWASLMFASIYLGMQNRILEEARRPCPRRPSVRPSVPSSPRTPRWPSVGHIIDGIGDMASRNELSRRVLYQTCTEVTEGKDDEWPLELRFPYIGLAKTFIADNVMHMSKKAMSLVGGSSFRQGTIFERLYRDSAASMFQPLNADQSTHLHRGVPARSPKNSTTDPSSRAVRNVLIGPRDVRSVGEELRDRLRSVGDAELAKDVLDMGLDRALRHRQPGGDLEVGGADRHQCQHLALAAP